MKYKKLKLSTVLLLGLGLTGLQAQTAIPATGGNVSGTGGSVSYSVGQVVYTTNTGGANGSVAQGVQQPFEISVVTGIDEANGITLQCSAYPNPTTDFLKLKVENFILHPSSFKGLPALTNIWCRKAEFVTCAFVRFGTNKFCYMAHRSSLR